MVTNGYPPDLWARILLSQQIDPAEFHQRTEGLHRHCCEMDRRLDEILSQRLQRQGARRLALLRRLRACPDPESCPCPSGLKSSPCRFETRRDVVLESEGARLEETREAFEV